MLHESAFLTGLRDFAARTLASDVLLSEVPAADLFLFYGHGWIGLDCYLEFLNFMLI
jgi:hypothetical protein